MRATCMRVTGMRLMQGTHGDMSPELPLIAYMSR